MLTWSARRAARRTSTQRLFALIGHEGKGASLRCYMRVGLKKNIIPNTQNVEIPRSIGQYLLFDYLKNTKHYGMRFLNIALLMHQLMLKHCLISSKSYGFCP